MTLIAITYPYLWTVASILLWPRQPYATSQFVISIRGLTIQVPNLTFILVELKKTVKQQGLSLLTRTSRALKIKGPIGLTKKQLAGCSVNGTMRNTLERL